MTNTNIKKNLTAEDIRKMTPEEVRKNYAEIIWAMAQLH